MLTLSLFRPACKYSHSYRRRTRPGVSERERRMRVKGRTGFGGAWSGARRSLAHSATARSEWASPIYLDRFVSVHDVARQCMSDELEAAVACAGGGCASRSCVTDLSAQQQMARAEGHREACYTSCLGMPELSARMGALCARGRSREA